MIPPRKIRVVHVLYSFGTGGLEKGIASLINNAPQDIEHIILCLSRAGGSTRLVPQGTRIIEMHKKQGNSIRFLLKLARALKMLKPDVVHTRNWGGMDGILAAKIAGCSTVVHGEHGWEIQDPSGLNLKRIIVRRLGSFIVKEYTCVSNHLKLWLIRSVKVRKPVSQIYNGVSIPGKAGSDYRKNVRQRLRIPEGQFIIGIVGRLDPIKDHLTLFHAFEMIQPKDNNCLLWVIGDGEERERLEEASSDNIVFWGNRTDVPQLMAAMDLFVLPSLNEGISNTILEAMAAGIPVIATDVGGNPELVDHENTGFIFQPGNGRQLVSFILAYMKNEKMRASHGNAGRKKVVHLFGIQKMAYTYHQIYRRAAVKHT